MLVSFTSLQSCFGSTFAGATPPKVDLQGSHLSLFVPFVFLVFHFFPGDLFILGLTKRPLSFFFLLKQLQVLGRLFGVGCSLSR